MGMRTELWNIRTHNQQWVGSADLLVRADGGVEGTMIFPTAHSDDKITGSVSGNRIELVRHLSSGPAKGQLQIWHGVYNPQGTAAAGEISGAGGPGDWHAAILVQ